MIRKWQCPSLTAATPVYRRFVLNLVLTRLRSIGTNRALPIICGVQLRGLPASKVVRGRQQLVVL